MKLKLLIVSCIIALAGYACRKSLINENQSLVSPPNGFGIAQAKNYLDSALKSHSSLIKLASIDSSKQANTTGFVYWKRARTSILQKFNVVEIPLITSHLLITLHDNPLDSVKIKPDLTVARSTFARLIVYQDNNTKAIDKEILIYQPDKAYLQAHQNDASSNWLDKFNSDFSGYVEYRKFDGTQKIIWRIVNGKRVRRYKITVNGVLKQQVQSIRPNEIHCYDACDEAYNETCDINEQGEKENCVTIDSGYQICTTECYDDGSNPDDPQPTDPGNGGGGGSGGGGGGGNPPSTTPKFDKLMRQTNALSQPQKSKVEQVLQQMISNCLGSALYNYFSSQGIQYDWSVNPNVSYAAAFNPQNSMITLKDPNTLNVQPLQEELFHAYQRSVYPGGTVQYANAPGSANIEFEAKVTADIQGLVAGGGSTLAVSGQAYFDWLKDVTNDYSTFPTSFTQSQLNSYFGFMQDFVNAGTGYGNTQIKSDLNPSAIFSLINRSSCVH